MRSLRVPAFQRHSSRSLTGVLVLFAFAHTAPLDAQSAPPASAPTGSLAQSSNAAPAASAGAPPVSQTADEPLPTFDVATVKPSDSPNLLARIMLPPDGLSVVNLPMNIILHMAYGTESDRILGIPEWIHDQRYDIEAKVDAENAPALKHRTSRERYSMLVPLLQDRFNLKFHHETRVLPVYVLTIAKGGSKLEAAKPYDPAAKTTRTYRMGFGTVDMDNMAMENLVNLLASELQRTVVNETGLTGRYIVKLHWTPEIMLARQENAPAGVAGKAESMQAPDTSAPPIFDALPQQLGLRLDSQKRSLDVIVIDHIEKPSPN